VKFHFLICLSPPSLWETLNWWMMLVLAKSVFCFFLLYLVWELEMHTVVSICWFSLTDPRKWSEIVHGMLGRRFGECQSTQYGGLGGPYFCAFVNSDIKSLCSVCWLSCCGVLKLCSHSVTLCLPSQILQ